ncbi:MAG TPA: tripartite tricarboxylate transporter substrate-binding protein [Xanthobacteraceae bacterium]|jgi:tripartite-type tricarboxylate transporter receptor subunit TctC|nr:tripartite tricarboxylate transporter substrate-binding protein [Xanthobacteraceae bacterium]
MIGRPSIGALAILAALTAAQSAFADAYPTRPITVVVPFAAGAVADLVARIVSERMRATLGQPIIVEDIPGAGGTIGVARATRAASDGYTISTGDLTSHVSSSAIFPVKYDTLRDLEPVALLSSAPQLFVARRDFPADDIPQLIAWLKANPDRASMALPGNFGNGGHLSGLSLQKITGTSFQFVPHRSSPQAVQNVVGGHVDLMFTDAANILPYVRSGQVKVFAVTTTTRWATAPEIPTLEELGIPLTFTLWRGLWVPAGTPKTIIEKLNAAVVEALLDPQVRKQLAELGNETYPAEQLTPDALRAHQKAEKEKWWPIIKAANITPD